MSLDPPERSEHPHEYNALSPLENLAVRAWETGRPYEVTWELTHTCPLACRHCFLGDKRNSPPPLDFSAAKSVLEKLSDAGILFLTFTGGEPLAHPDFFRIADYARQLRFALRLYTSGYLLDSDAIAGITEIGFGKVDMTIMGVEENHDRLVGRSGAFARVVAAARALRKAGIRVHLKTTVIAENHLELDAMRRIAEDFDCSFETSFFLASCINPPQAGCGARTDGINPVKTPSDKTAVKLYLAAAERDPSFLEDVSPEEALLCGAGRSSWAIAPNGDVFPCVVFRYKCGNILSDDFEAIHSSHGMRAVRNIGVEDLAICRDCSIAGFCRRCPGESFAETGDWLAPNREACRDAGIRAEAMVQRRSVERKSGE